MGSFTLNIFLQDNYNYCLSPHEIGLNSNLGHSTPIYYNWMVITEIKPTYSYKSLYDCLQNVSSESSNNVFTMLVPTNPKFNL